MQDIDQAVHAAFNAHSIPGYDLFFYAITQMGSAPLWIAVFTICLLIGKWKKIAAIMIITLAFGMVINDDLKDIFQHPRPDNAVVWSYFSHNNYSFPSGHTETAFIVATVLSAYVAWRYWPVLYLLAGAVGISRLYLDVHYLTDVAAGAATGILIGVLVIYGLHRMGLYEREGMFGIVTRPIEKNDRKGWNNTDLIKYAAIVLAAGFFAAIAALLVSQYVLSLAIIGAMYIVLLLLPSFLKGHLHTDIH